MSTIPTDLKRLDRPLVTGNKTAHIFPYVHRVEAGTLAALTASVIVLTR